MLFMWQSNVLSIRIKRTVHSDSNIQRLKYDKNSIFFDTFMNQQKLSPPFFFRKLSCARVKSRQDRLAPAHKSSTLKYRNWCWYDTSRSLKVLCLRFGFWVVVVPTRRILFMSETDLILIGWWFWTWFIFAMYAICIFWMFEMF